MRATDGLQTTITLGSVNHDGQAFSLGLSLEMSLPIPQQDEHLPDQIEAYVHQAGLEVQRQLFRVLIEKADQELVLQRRQGKGGAGIQRRGTRPFTFTGKAKAALASSAGEHDPSLSKQPSARSPLSDCGSATIMTARSRPHRRPSGTHPTNSPSPRISGTRSVIR